MGGDLFLDKYRDLWDPMKKPEEDIPFFGRITGSERTKTTQV